MESRLQETSAEFEATRAMAKKTRSDFEIIKKQRYVATYVVYFYEQDVVKLAEYEHQNFAQLKCIPLWFRPDR